MEHPPEETLLPTPTPKNASLSGVLQESLYLLGRNFVVVYPIIVYFIALSFLTPPGKPDYSQVVWWVMQFGLITYYSLCEAGWTAMMYRAVAEWQTEKRALDPQPKSLLSAFGLLTDFIPGIGVYGPSFLLAGLLSYLLTGGSQVLIIWLGERTLGLPKAVKRLQENPNLSFQELLNSSSNDPNLSQWSLICLLIIGICITMSWLFLYWRQYLIITQKGPINALTDSIKLAIRHPFHTTALLLLSGLLPVLCLILVLAGGVFNLIGVFLGFLSIAFLGLTLTLYVLEIGQATPYVDPTPTDTPN